MFNSIMLFLTLRWTTSRGSIHWWRQCLCSWWRRAWPGWRTRTSRWRAWGRSRGGRSHQSRTGGRKSRSTSHLKYWVLIDCLLGKITFARIHTGPHVAPEPLVLLWALDGDKVHAALAAVVAGVEPVPLGRTQLRVITLPRHPVEMVAEAVVALAVHSFEKERKKEKARFRLIYCVLGYRFSPAAGNRSLSPRSRKISFWSGKQIRHFFLFPFAPIVSLPRNTYAQKNPNNSSPLLFVTVVAPEIPQFSTPRKYVGNTVHEFDRSCLPRTWQNPEVPLLITALKKDT